jgi:hypothetical protein
MALRNDTVHPVLRGSPAFFYDFFHSFLLDPRLQSVGRSLLQAAEEFGLSFPIWNEKTIAKFKVLILMGFRLRNRPTDKARFAGLLYCSQSAFRGSTEIGFAEARAYDRL